MKRRIMLHGAFWLAYWFIYAYTNSRYDGNFVKYASSEAILLPFRLLSVYGSFWVLDHFSQPSGEEKPGRNWLIFTGIVAANVLGAMGNRWLKLVYVVPTFFPDATFEFFNFARFTIELFDCAIATGAALSARLFFRQQDLLRREAILQREKTAAELQALKSQVQPHFLFNTINNIYALARRKSDKTAPVTLKLANLLRFVLYETRKPSIPLEQEVNILRDYVELEKLRFDSERLRVEFEVAMDDPQQAVTPLLLLPLVENAFKHGAGEHRLDAWVKVDIRLKNKELRVEIGNSKSARTGNEKAKSPLKQGLGLQNVQRQLELIYPARHELSVQDLEAVFRVYLELRF